MVEIDFTRQATFILCVIQIILVPLLHGNVQPKRGLSFPFIPCFSFKKQNDTAHKGIYSLPGNLQSPVLISGFLPTFSLCFLI